MSEESPIFFAEGEDPRMVDAYERAQATFRYFWREMAWERRRIIPALGVAAVKAPFRDKVPSEDDGAEVEHMWVSDIEFDGAVIKGTVLNQPRWLESVAERDEVELSLEEISDWMYSIDDRVYGAFTVQVIRQDMDAENRRTHDEAWGLDFGDPNDVRVIPVPDDSKRAGLLSKLTGMFKSKPPPPPPDLSADHPMSVNMGPSLEEHLTKDPDAVHVTDDRGWTMLHDLALAGSATAVPILLAHGADRNAKTKDGRTPADLARSLGWDAVLALLQVH